MKKTLMSLAVASTLISSVAMAASTANDSSTANLTFKGKVTSSLCQINTGDVNKEILLPEVSASDLATTGASTPVSFTVSLENCDQGTTSIDYTFQDNNGNGTVLDRLIPVSEQGSVNPDEIGVYLQDNLGTDLEQGTVYSQDAITDASDVALPTQTIPLRAYIGAVGGAGSTVTAGSVNASATMTIKANGNIAP